MHSTSVRTTLAVVLFSLGNAHCNRTTSAQQPVTVAQTPAQPLQPDAYLVPTASPPRQDSTPLPALFASKVGCLKIEPRAFSVPSAEGHEPNGFRSLTESEVRARPWLWGQRGSGCTGPFMPPRGLADAHPEYESPDLATRIRAASEHYLGWARVDDQQRWAPMDCILRPGSVPRGDLQETAPHGRKLYYLYARDRDAYRTHRDVAGQIIVKESWSHHEISTAQAILSGRADKQCVPTSADRCEEPVGLNGLFLMLRARDNETSDAGWLYATVNADGRILASGIIAACARCHRDAPHGRLFGLSGPALER